MASDTQLPAWAAALQSEIAPAIPDDAVTVAQFAAAAKVDRQRIQQAFQERVEAGTMARAKKGRAYYYWPTAPEATQ